MKKKKIKIVIPEFKIVWLVKYDYCSEDFFIKPERSFIAFQKKIKNAYGSPKEDLTEYDNFATAMIVAAKLAKIPYVLKVTIKTEMREIIREKGRK